MMYPHYADPRQDNGYVAILLSPHYGDPKKALWLHNRYLLPVLVVERYQYSYVAVASLGPHGGEMNTAT